MSPDPVEPAGGPERPDPQNPSADLLLWAYCRGIFPMANPETGEMGWYSPDPRGVLPLDAMHVPRNVARLVRQRRFEIRADTAFQSVMRACAKPRHVADLPWIDDRLIAAYTTLHERAQAHSVEAWRARHLVGGLYGVHIGSAFFGESMFVEPSLGGSNASKVCLVHLVDHLRRQGFLLLDTQFINPHLKQFGCIEVPRPVYLRRLREAIRHRAAWGELHVPAARTAP